MTNIKIAKMTEDFVMHTYGRFSKAFVSGKGARLTDADGKVYLDFLAGLAVCNLGHSHPRVTEAIQKQAETLIHTSNFFHIEAQAELAKLIAENSFADKTFFSNSGAEAVEAAIKLARKYFSVQKNSGKKRHRVISMERSFHGRTTGAMAATGQKKIQEGFEPMLEKFSYVPFGDIDALRDAIDDTTAAVLLEPIQGEGGVNISAANYLKDVRLLCDEAGILMILDEVQTGIGRTGKLFAYEHYGIEPDIMTLAKGLANGVPIGAMCATDKVASAFGPGSHASTFGGNFLSTSAGLATINSILEEDVLQNSEKVGEYLMEKLNKLKGDFDFIKEVRGMGLLVAMELTKPGAGIVLECLERGLIINCTADKVLRFLPPLIITSAEVDEMIGILRGVLEEA
ncbi:MAG: acetylornithine transaminase [Deltaproteobacteria bacterium]|nr:acetylornithine transaminase [Deltaproteobacteria bacterium]